jgi:hypothetical protein
MMNRFERSVCLRPILHPRHVYVQIHTRLSIVDEALPSLALACIWIGPFKEVSWKVLMVSHRSINSRVLPVGVPG